MANPKSDMKDRWIPKSLTERIKKIHSMSDYIEVRNNDAMELIEEMYWNPKNCIFLIHHISKKSCAICCAIVINVLLHTIFSILPAATIISTYNMYSNVILII